MSLRDRPRIQWPIGHAVKVNLAPALQRYYGRCPRLAVKWFVGKPLSPIETSMDPWNGDIGLQGTTTIDVGTDEAASADSRPTS